MNVLTRRLLPCSSSTLRCVRFFTAPGQTSTNRGLTDRLLSKDIPTVQLAFDAYTENTSSLDPRPPVLILHGLFGCKTNNRSIAKSLNEVLERDIYCLDLRNHGESPSNPRHDYPALAADVERFIHDHDIGESVVIGHSMGAKTAMALALRSKNLVEMMIAVDNAPVSLPPGSDHLKYISIMQQIVDNPEIKSNRDANNFFGKFEKDISVRQFLLQNIRKDKESGLMKSRIPLDIMKDILVKGNIASWEFDPNFSQYSGPSLFIRGTKSMYVPDEYLVDVGKFFPAFEVRDIDAGHWVMAEKPKESLDVIVDFIQRKEDY
ncbi:CYFA0S13e00584g1_1 [Cyberlindnera fabianii]|uniref:CYFA0S13e00584g1_1 n=1 Tax=Cyberlindnera fabianii TaxID=36022 RepID=A0A061B373_CYBFA|nr:CYFA0S13e00584g1_1 [Cyberlindnera fabianii]